METTYRVLTMGRAIVAILSMVVIVAITWTMGYAAGAHDPAGPTVVRYTVPAVAPIAVPCPTEDSCAVDYIDGAWHITPIEP
jgi:hypothetical protein